MLPADLFLHDVELIHAFLEKKNIETWMWGDMLLSPDEFPGYSSTYFHGTGSGYGKALRQKIPRAIVICDWHYSGDQAQFPSLAAFQEDGFRVVGAVWEDENTAQNYSRQAAEASALGMMATTWFYVPQQRWDQVEQILRASAAAFRVLDRNDR